MSDLILWVQTVWQRQIKRKSTFKLLEHYISLLSSVSYTRDSGGEVPRAWQTWGSELCCWLSCARRALSKLDRVIKMGVKDVILYLTLCCPAQLLWTGISSRVKPLQSPGSLCSGSRDDKSFSGMARAHARTHTFTSTCTQSYYVTPALRRVWHMLMRQALPVAGSTALSSTAAHHYRNQSHFHLHHLSSSHWWREGVAIIFSPTQSGELTNLSPYVSLSHSWNASHTQTSILYLAPDTCNEQKLICKVTELLLIQRRRVIHQKAHRVVTVI